MGLFQNFLHFITGKPMPLSETWQNIEENCLTKDKKAPVTLVSVRFKPEKEELRKHIAPIFLEEKFNEISDLLTYYCSKDSQDAPGFLYLYDDFSRYYGDITINWYAEGTGKRKGLYIKISDDIDETIEMTLRKSIEVILHPLKSRPDVGFSLEYKMGAAHPDWEIPTKFENLTF
ncbi:MAG: hypothetical protein NE330_14900 [Lentisphaeraceae bacterium]|nr:hypothetical protein [Lentisphaeraceae bacterium]